MKDEYNNWKKAWAAGAALTLVGEAAREMGGIIGPLEYGMALMCCEILIWYVFTGCASVRGRFTAGSLGSMAFWNIIGSCMAAVAMWFAGVRPDVDIHTLPITIGMSVCAGALQAAAYRTQSAPMMLAAGTMIAGIGLPFYLALSPGLIAHGWRGGMYFFLVLIGNRVGAWLIAAIEEDPRR